MDDDHLIAPGEDPLPNWVRSGRHGTRFELHRFDFIAARTPQLSRLTLPKLRELSRAWAGRLAAQQGNSVQLSDKHFVNQRAPAGRRKAPHQRNASTVARLNSRCERSSRWPVKPLCNATS